MSYFVFAATLLGSSRTHFVVGIILCWSANCLPLHSQSERINGNPNGVKTITVLKPVSSTNSAKSRQQLWEQLDRETAELKRQSRILKTLIKLVKPSIAHIEAEKTTSSPTGNKKVEETGAGVVFKHRSKFYILTNRHVIKNAENYRIKVIFEDGTFHNPVRVITDKDTDIAVMEIAGNDLVVGRFGDSTEVESGDFVFAFGSPFGLKHSVSYGIVSAKGRRNLELGEGGVKYQDFFQTDAAINPGNSGGPLVNLDGKVIGINTAIASNSGGNDGVGFSIPINMAMDIANQLIDHGKVKRAFLGVQLESKFTIDTAKRLGLSKLRGAKVNLVNIGTPAHKAGLKAGDVILTFQGKEVQDDSDLVNQVSTTRAGQPISLHVWRDHQTLKLTTTLVLK
ncbi:MAG: trypsin-like peptidase domain-containing protein [Planctomycetota bacterium]|nr:trypsin-like peptidase domain-containing protein [Planctomycetota bacterium]